MKMELNGLTHHCTSNPRCCPNAGPALQTVAQHLKNIEKALGFRVRWVMSQQTHIVGLILVQHWFNVLSYDASVPSVFPQVTGIYP